MATGMIQEIKKYAKPKSFPDSDTYKGISVEHVIRLSEQFEVPGKEIEIAALEAEIVPERYARNMKSYTLDDQVVLLKSTVSVVGLGGLGGGVTEILARSGVGTLLLMDGDSFEDHNLNRQFLSRQSLLLTSKAEAALQRVREINSSIAVRHFGTFLTKDNGADMIEGSDVAVDCLDSLHTRTILEKLTKSLNIPMVSAAVAGGSGHVTTIFPEDPGLKLIYGEQVDPSLKGAEASLGCLPQAVTLLSSLECSEVLKILLKKGNLARNKLIVVDLLDNTFDVLQLA
ncbi:MAG TPA: HesA/MoeB/ThiF family protein [Deltaproteobacteria bacterium]|nr:HesA/MoeB/ThiF family protein [Deltaproteobacteria bacterium]